jgi:uncharacterized protein (DUF1778 family)
MRKLAHGEKRSTVVAFKVKPADYDALRRNAEAAGVTVSDYIRKAISAA